MSHAHYASAIVVGEQGLLIRGPSGSGKSSLSLSIIALARRTGIFAALVADDRVLVSVSSGRLVAECVPGFSGCIERRGVGLIQVPFEHRAVLRLIIDLASRGVALSRMPAEEEQSDIIAGVSLPRLLLDLASGVEHGIAVALDSLQRVEKDNWRKNTSARAYFA